MGFVGELKLKKPRRAVVNFGRFYGVDHRVDGDVSGFNRADMCFNFSCKDGTLKTTFGLKNVNDKFTLPDYAIIDSLYYFRRNDYENGVNDDRLIAYATSGKMYTAPASGGELTLIEGLTFNKKPIGVCYNYNSKDVIIFSAEGEGIKIYDGNTVTVVSDCPSVTSMCVHSERLFITSGGVDGALWFSDDFDPTNWNVSLTEAGFIDMSDERGEMLCAVAFGGHVYVFRSYGVSRVTAYGDQSDFSVSHLLVSCGKICKNTIIVCGDCILFFASDGLYRFDGYTAVRISDPWFANAKTDFDWLKGVYFNGYAYYIIKFKVRNEYYAGVFAITPDGSDYAYTNIASILDLTVLSGENIYKLYAIERLKFGFFEVAKGAGWDGDNVHMEWWSKESDFGVKGRQKRLKRVSFYANSPIKLTVTVNGEDHVFNLTPRNGLCETKMNIKGERFQIKFYSFGLDTEISAPELEFTYYA